MLPLANRSHARFPTWLLALCLTPLFQHAAGASLPDSLFQRWIHSYEEDTINTLAFRPSGYSFPPARGRDGFEICADGKFILLGPGGNDRSSSVTGHWTHSKNWTLRVIFANNDLNREIHIVDLEPQLLRIQR
jgi:hypothetical protein